jgi:hypothetical protein
VTPSSSSQIFGIFLKFREIVIKMTQFDEFFEYHKIIEVFQMTERRPDGATIQKFLSSKAIGSPPSQIFLYFSDFTPGRSTKSQFHDFFPFSTI